MEKMFEKASRLKLRFETSKGLLSTEDLWELNLTSLDSIAKGVNKKLKDETEESFIAVKSSKNTELELKLEILKHVIAEKMAAQEAAKNRAVRNAKLSQLKDLAARKANAELDAKSLDEINAMITELEKEE